MGSLIESLAITAITITAILALIPAGGTKRVAAGVGTAILLMTLLIKGKTVTSETAVGRVSDWEDQLEETATAYKGSLEEELRKKIKESTEKLTEEKAAEMGLHCDAHITFSGENLLEIEQVEIIYTGKSEEDAAMKLRNWLKEELQVDYSVQNHIRS